MFRLANLLTLALVIAIASGCADQPPLVQPATQTAVQPVAQAIRINKPANEPKSITEKHEAPSNRELDPEKPAEPERILLLARGGPLILDLFLTVDGKPYGQAIESLVERVISAGNTDGDSRSTWDEWRQNEEFLRGDLAKLDPIRKRTVNNWVTRYDENSDGRIQRAEAAAWLGRDSGRSASGLRMRSSRTYAALNATKSRLWQALDRDQNGQLGRAELAAAVERLFELDTDDNRIVDAAELASLREQLNAQRQLRSSYERMTQRDAAVRLQRQNDASELDYLLSDLYAPRQQLGPTSFSARTRLFKSLDVDGDQLLDSQELAAMLSIEPHVKLAVDFRSEHADAKLTLLDQAVEIQSVTLNADDRMILETADSRLVFSASDLRSNASEQAALDANEISLMIHDRTDALYETLDANADGRLGEREIVEAADRISAADTDGDQQLRPSELAYSMTIVFARGESRGQRSFYVPRSMAAVEYEDTTPTWFRHADLNADGDMSRGEFLGDDTQFSALDQNSDGFVSPSEAVGIVSP